MTEAARLSKLIMSLEGVHTLYPADPAWKYLARRVQDALAPAPGDPATDRVFVSTEGTSTTARVRVGADGSVPAADLARNIAEVLRTSLADHLRGSNVNVVVEISSIRYVPCGTGPTT
ncbi:hypothetical protein [Pseudarthrobacter sp. PH31-O2]|uniref:hypothetical protein n=1 Tax=Pseudarthrobacter sp. PH31-O2 TaxID=3046206 RepID=UPI0024BB5686|nr:hypothetical protein [Pseudarthrobacter sp. PH31-O2]MDJ0354309.1 hypothetical protein [Pseudarthrobacter sp. PH31-O2]